MTISFLHLPDEIILNVLNRLPESDQRSCASVCKLFQTLVSEEAFYFIPKLSSGKKITKWNIQNEISKIEVGCFPFFKKFFFYRGLIKIAEHYLSYLKDFQTHPAKTLQECKNRFHVAITTLTTLFTISTFLSQDLKKKICQNIVLLIGYKNNYDWVFKRGLISQLTIEKVEIGKINLALREVRVFASLRCYMHKTTPYIGSRIQIQIDNSIFEIYRKIRDDESCKEDEPISTLYFNVGDFEESKDERHSLSLTTAIYQLAVEIFFKEEDERLILFKIPGKPGDFTQVGVMGGFFLDHPDYDRIEREIKRDVLEARTKDIYYPEPFYQSPSSMLLEKNRSVDVCYELDGSSTTWQEKIEKNPILFGNKPFFPR